MRLLLQLFRHDKEKEESPYSNETVHKLSKKEMADRLFKREVAMIWLCGFALTEAIALFAFMMAFLISFVFRSKKEGRRLVPENALVHNIQRLRNKVAVGAYSLIG